MNKLTTILFVAFIAIASNAFAAGPGTISYQGKVTNHLGVIPHDSLYSMKFEFYDALVKGNLKWTETYDDPNDVSVIGGVFSVQLGSQKPFPAGLFTSNPDLWLQVQVDLDGDGFEASEIYTPRISISAVPYAFTSDFSSDGGGAGNSWDLTGNSGTNPTTHFLGTTDDQPLEIKVNDNRIFRLESNVESPNIIGGYNGNFIIATVEGATIGGGGADTFENKVTDNYGTVAGGYNNQAGNDLGTTIDAGYATVGGGKSNKAPGGDSTVSGGLGNTAGGNGSAISGGLGNATNNQLSAISGGAMNVVSGNNGSIGGGESNQINATHGAVAGGKSNQANGDYSAIGGGASNTAGANYASVGGGQTNSAAGTHSAVSGGSGNTAGANFAYVGGGEGNSASNTHAAIGGGKDNQAGNTFATVGGGENNKSNNTHATVSGGFANEATGLYAAVGGGYSNKAIGNRSTIAGGENNNAEGNHSVVGGGGSNKANNAFAVASGGHYNEATGANSTIPGGINNTASGDYSFAAGNQAKALHNGSFVWSDSSSVDFSSVQSDQFIIEANGGYGFGTNDTDSNEFLVNASGGVGFNASIDPSSNEFIVSASSGIAFNSTNHPSDGEFNIIASKGVGIGTDNPTYQLDVLDNASGQYVTRLGNSNTGNNSSILALMFSDANIDVTNNFITFYSGLTAIGAIEPTVPSGGVTYKSGSADFAEYIQKLNPNDTLSPGEIVGCHANQASLKTEGAEKVFAISTAPIVLGNQPMEGEESKFIKAALLGQVPINVCGKVNVGDYIIPSGLNDGAGKAVSTDRLNLEMCSMIVGQALESSNDEGVKQVLAFVGLPKDQIWVELLQERDTQMSEMRQELNELKSTVNLLIERNSRGQKLVQKP